MTNPAAGSPSEQNRADALLTLESGIMNVSEILKFAEHPIGRDLRILTLREVLLHARGVNARVVLARLTAFGIDNAESIRVRDVLDAKHLALITDALSANDMRRRHSGRLCMTSRRTR
jgi:hypothetical protein